MKTNINVNWNNIKLIERDFSYLSFIPNSCSMTSFFIIKSLAFYVLFLGLNASLDARIESVSSTDNKKDIEVKT